jgi:hypothetical protein
VVWSCSAINEGKVLLDVVDSWKKPIGPDWFAMPTPSRTSGFFCTRLSLLCSRTCAAEAWPAHPRSFLQERRAWSHLRCAASALLSHHWPSTCSRVVCCFAYARTCGNESSRPLAKHFRSHSRTRRFNSARTSGSCNFAVLSTYCDTIRAGLPPPLVLRCASNLRCVAPASTSVWMKGARRAWLHRISSELVMPDRRLHFAASPSGSLRHNRSSASAAPLLSCACLCCTHVHSLLLLFLLIC